MTDFLDRKTFEDCMRQVFNRLDRQQEMLASMQEDKKEKPPMTEMLEDDTMDNQDVCMLLHVSKRTLQRYRSDGLLPYRMHRHKTYYRRSDVELFITTHMKEILRDRTPGKTDAAGKNSKKGKTNRKK
ncbi:helix-turn-helix domain-containing protein [Phocaeicola massiliensis]|uniref:helix-turn-helix domain-containing protein n=1 Tax=Phocaeicola massiliensis TaxID=204516 RepID=UPI00202F5BFA|nr:helix-turn-helix domain-containing protein [Phocaeicola massiliensis]MCM1613848.1 helix-turn-helix domain-containing protein [Phocaeicola massiliensis]MCM1705835.1 helix-turn-helix domain-containing protein [Phocaeicola massiliensis]